MTKYRTKKRALIVIILTIIMTTGLLIHRHKRIKYKKPIKTIKVTNQLKEFKRTPTNKEKPFKFFSYEGYDKKLEKFIEIVQAKIKQNKIDEENQRKEQERLRLLDEQRKLDEQKKKELITRGGNTNNIEWINIRVSYYTVSDIECGKSDGITASGKNIQEGMIAAPKDIPFGTKITIPELGDEYTVEDRGGAIQWNGDTMKIDVYVPNASQRYLNKLGVKYVKGYIIK